MGTDQKNNLQRRASRACALLTANRRGVDSGFWRTRLQDACSTKKGAAPGEPRLFVFFGRFDLLGSIRGLVRNAAGEAEAAETHVGRAVEEAFAGDEVEVVGEVRPVLHLDAGASEERGAAAQLVIGLEPGGQLDHAMGRVP